MELRPSLEAEEVRPVDSLHRRYFYKLATGFVGLALSVVTQAIIPRGLGPRVYGDFAFLSNFFTRVVGFFDTGTSLGFYIKVSQRPRESGLVTFYGYFVGLVALLVAGLVLLSQTTGVWVHVWPSQNLGAIYLAAVWGLLTWMVRLATMMADAYGLTVQSSLASMAQKALGLALIALLFGLHWLRLTTFFFYHYAIMSFFLVAVAWLLRRGGHGVDWQKKLSAAAVRGYLREFFDYSHPLFFYALVGLVTGVLDRWLLQVFGGSVQQGFFGLSYQIGALCFLFTGAMTPLLTREFAIAFEKQDLAQMAHLFRRYIPLFYGVAAYFACFLAVQADKVIYLMGGKNFQGAYLAVTIMLFYPIHQTYGQLSGSVFYATGQTALYRNIGIIIMVIGLPVTYFLIAPTDKMGLNAGASGLAIKMVALQFVAVNIQLYFNSKLLGLRFWTYVAHQIITVACLLGVALLVTLLVDKVLLIYTGTIVRFFLAGLLYTLVTIAVLYFQPIIFGLKKQDISLIRSLILERFSSI
jgi:O-antigen/teichoic acid export membrane protein